MITLRPYQVDCFNSVLQYFKHNKGNPIVAMPCATGKSLIIGELIRFGMSFPNQKILVLTHVKELIKQNFDTALDIYPQMQVGIYSAGLGVKDESKPVTFAGIQSVYKKPEIFGKVNLVLIDECHLVSENDDSMYLSFIKALKRKNKKLKVCGFSATPYRSKDGCLTNGKLFTDICHDLTSLKNFNKLIADGYLSPLVAKATVTGLDVSGVDVVGGEFASGQLQAAVNIDSVTAQAVREMTELGRERKRWLVFGSGIEHAESITRWLIAYGVSAVCIHSKMDTDVRDAKIKAFKNGLVRAAVNNMVLTTGSNIPDIDLIADLQPILSPPKHVQKGGRGTRISPGKTDCLYLDYARNTENLGPINNVWMPDRARKGKGIVGTAPVKICPQCRSYVPAMAVRCEYCDKEFPRRVKIVGRASGKEIIEKEAVRTEIFDVTRVTYTAHKKDKTSMKVTYICGLRRFHEWICFEHPGYARRTATKWHLERSYEEVPSTIEQALKVVYKEPKQLKVWINKKYPSIVEHLF